MSKLTLKDVPPVPAVLPDIDDELDVRIAPIGFGQSAGGVDAIVEVEQGRHVVMRSGDAREQGRQ